MYRPWLDERAPSSGDGSTVMKPTLHVVGLPWTETTRAYTICAYTEKLRKACGMFRDQGYPVVLYAGEENEADCDEHVCLVSKEEREGWFGPWNSGDAFSYITWEPSETPWLVMNNRAVAEIARRRDTRDLLCIVGGLSQRPIAQQLGMLTCEPFVGYEGIWTDFCAFESSAWMHYLYGKYPHMAGNPNSTDANGRWYDTVIPNYFDPADFYRGPKEDYLLFVGRLIERKGPHVAAKIADALGMKLVVAGPGMRDVTHSGGVTKIFGDGVVIEGNDLEFVGSVGPEQRAELMSGARALLAPTFYLEPFGGVTVEAMMSGTPAVTSNWGAFRETVVPDVSGYRFNTLAEGCKATEMAMALDSQAVQDYALGRFSMDAVGPEFDRWFTQISGLWDGGWDTLPAPDMSGVTS